MGIIMLNGVKYGGSGGSGAGDEYERKPIKLYNGKLSSGSVTIELHPYLEYSFQGLERPVCYNYMEGIVESQIFKIRIIGDCSYQPFFQECYLAGLKQQYVRVSGGVTTWECIRVCDSMFGYSKHIYPYAFNGEKITSNGYISLELIATQCYSNYPVLYISLCNPSNLKLMRVELL